MKREVMKLKSDSGLIGSSMNDEFFSRSNFHHLISPLAHPRGKLQTNREKAKEYSNI